MPDNKKKTSSQPAKTAPKGDTTTAVNVVALGGSAGGLKALEEFFSTVSGESDLAYVILIHANPDQPTMLAELLGKISRIPVALIEEGDKLTGGRVYVTPPGSYATIDGGAFSLTSLDNQRITMPIDMMFRAFAETLGERLAAVVLSGSNADGATGIKTVKEHNGLVMVQDEESAEYPIMPRHAIATRIADFILPPDEMPERVHSIFDGLKKIADATGDDSDARAMRTIFSILEHRIGHDFSGYKKSSMSRRITRRMSVNGVGTFGKYADYLRSNQVEIETLFHELLIGVTQFFRDREAFTKLQALLEDKVLPGHAPGDTFRVWVPGCSTGEEVYSLAIILQESCRRLGLSLDFQIFGTDIDERAIEVARQGIYPASIKADVDERLLNRYFTSENTLYRIKPAIRDNIVFSIQNVLHDPPFSRLNLLCCRNLLIYLTGEMQQSLLPLFHHTLRPNGLLMLGPSESIGRFADLFHTRENQWKIFQRREVVLDRRYPLIFPHRRGGIKRPSENEPQTPPNTLANLEKATRQAVLTHFSPTAILISTDGEIYNIHGRPGKYIEHQSGGPTNNLINLAREGLRIELASAIRQAANTKKTVVRRQISVKTNGDTQMIDLHVQPFPTGDLQDYLLVAFVDVDREVSAPSLPPGKNEDEAHRVEALEEELLQQRQHHQATIEELDTTNEELKSTNEEMQSTNEELQSSNEELESSKEELQSLNEEMQTVNAELQSKVDELRGSNDDMRNLLNSTHIATVFVDHEHRIRRFTEEIVSVINLINTDINRPLRHVATNLEDVDLELYLNKVSKDLTPISKEVRTTSGDWYAMRMVPYRASDNRIDGAVITFSEINSQKEAQEQLAEAKERFKDAWSLVRHVFDMTEEPTVVLDRHGKIVIANRSFSSLWNISPEEVTGKDFIDGGIDAFADIDLSARLKKAFKEGEDFTTEPFPLTGVDDHRRWSLKGRIIREGDEFPYRIIITFEQEGEERGRKEIR